jgi:hypothetical protein
MSLLPPCLEHTAHRLCGSHFLPVGGILLMKCLSTSRGTVLSDECVQPHIHTLRRDPPLAVPGKIAVQFFSLCFPKRESEHLVQCCSVTSGTASCTIYLSCVIWHTFPDKIFRTSRHCFIIIVITSLKLQSQQRHQQNDHYLFHNRRNLDLYHYILT